MARVPLLRQDDLPEDYQYLMSEDALGERHIFGAMGNNPAILRSYMLYGNTLWEECGLDAHERELAILAVGRALRSRYEWQQHYDIGLAERVSVEEMRAIGRDDLSWFDDRLEATLAFVQAVATDDVTDDQVEALSAYYDDEAVAGICMLATHYVATARMLSGLDVPLESDFVGWEPAE